MGAVSVPQDKRANHDHSLYKHHTIHSTRHNAENRVYSQRNGHQVDPRRYDEQGGPPPAPTGPASCARRSTEPQNYTAAEVAPDQIHQSRATGTRDARCALHQHGRADAADGRVGHRKSETNG